MIKQLTRSFQRLSRFRQEWVTVAEEVSFIQDFLAIQQYRFGPGSSIRWRSTRRFWNGRSRNW